MEEFRRVIVETDPESGSEVVDRLQQAGTDDFDSLLQRDSEELAEELSIPVELIISLQNQLSAHREPIPLEEITGIGSTYADRLREEGVQGVAELAQLDPETVSKISNASTSRAADWVEQAKEMVQRG
jgi:predicted flap endonuclease-1-like 5' DNA nuclease